MKNKELQTIRKMVIHGLYAVSLKRGYGLDVFAALKAEQNRLFDNYERNAIPSDEQTQKNVMEPSYKPGDTVYIIERYEDGEAFDYSGYMFIASVGDAVVVSSFINNLKTVEDILNEHIIDTANGDDVNLYVFPGKDCYATKKEAEEALSK